MAPRRRYNLEKHDQTHLVLSVDDIQRYLSPKARYRLEETANAIATGREADGLEPVPYYQARRRMVR